MVTACLIILSMRPGLSGKGLSDPAPYLHNHKFHLYFCPSKEPVLGTGLCLAKLPVFWLRIWSSRQRPATLLPRAPHPYDDFPGYRHRTDRALGTPCQTGQSPVPLGADREGRNPLSSHRAVQKRGIPSPTSVCGR